MCLETIEEVAAYLDGKSRYRELLSRYRADSANRSIWFEMVFAYWLEDAGIVPSYEQAPNPEAGKTVDYCFAQDGYTYYLELVRIEHSDEVLEHIDAQKAADGLFEGYTLILNSDHTNPFFRTAAQIIRLQEKILEKVEKFAEPTQSTLSIIVVDCTNIHSGMLDDEDVRVSAFGRSKNAVWQEYWNGNRLKGVFESDYQLRGADELRRKIHAIIFVNALRPGALHKSFFVVNPAFDVAANIVNVKPLNVLTNVRNAF